MAKFYPLEVVTPERVMLNEDVEFTIAPGADGELGILVRHAPLMTALKPGELRATLADGRTTAHIVIGGGFLEVAHTGTVTVLADSAERADEIDIDRAEADLDAARRMLAEAELGSHQYERARRAVDHAETRVRVARPSGR
jgi:F-type H+-transporting ATPase subunit epsilon